MDNAEAEAPQRTPSGQENLAGGGAKAEDGGADHGDSRGEAGGDEENRVARRNSKRKGEAGGGVGNSGGTTQFEGLRERNGVVL